jgi:leader peptidase (prepilin peptidase)/N-methyltransferase
MESFEWRRGKSAVDSRQSAVCAFCVLPAAHCPLPTADFILHPSSFILLTWFFALGAVIGSFLNVVVYRLPAGKSLVYPGSHCPICNHPIRWYDNVPVLGWLILHGRCRDCHAPISPRYPIVEAIAGGIFAVLALPEFIAPGIHWPQDAVGSLQLLLDDAALHEACGLYACHAVLLSTLLAAALFERDGQRVPWRLGIFAAAVGLLVPLVWLHPLGELTRFSDEPASVLEMLKGIAAGLLVGLAAWRPMISQMNIHIVWRRRCIGTAEVTALPVGAMLVPMLVGLYLGWQAVLVVAAIATAGHVATTFVSQGFKREKPRLGWCSWWVAVTLAWIVCRPWLTF